MTFKLTFKVQGFGAKLFFYSLRLIFIPLGPGPWTPITSNNEFFLGHSSIKGVDLSNCALSLGIGRELVIQATYKEDCRGRDYSIFLSQIP